MRYDFFNGDADGLCSIVQLRLEDPIDSVLVTGVKRDINLLKGVEFKDGDIVFALDVSLERNRESVIKALGKGATITWIDHHLPGEDIVHPEFRAFIDYSPDVCTSILVDKYLNGKRRPWAVVGAFGDSMNDSAIELAGESFNQSELEELRNLGQFLNYNSYGRSVSDLHFHPLELYKAMTSSVDPFTFINSSIFKKLSDGYQEDMGKAVQMAGGKVLIQLPNEPWAFRISGSLAHKVARDEPNEPHVVTIDLGDDNLRVSIRAPYSDPRGVGELCQEFGGGGRSAAGGIDCLPVGMLDELITRVCERWLGGE